jgi:hypothetical protein
MTTQELTASATMRAQTDEAVDSLTEQEPPANSTASLPLAKLTSQGATWTSPNVSKVQTATIEEVV